MIESNTKSSLDPSINELIQQAFESPWKAQKSSFFYPSVFSLSPLKGWLYYKYRTWVLA